MPKTKYPNTGRLHLTLHFGPDLGSTIVLPANSTRAQVSYGGYNEPVDEEYDLVEHDYLASKYELEDMDMVALALHNLATDLEDRAYTLH